MFDVIAFDADDTLWHNENVYRDVQGKIIALLAQYHSADWIERRMFETEVRNINNIRMAQPARCACFAPEALNKLAIAHELRRDQFESNVTIGAEVRGKINGAHTAASEESFEAVFVVKYLAQVLLGTLHKAPMLPETP